VQHPECSSRYRKRDAECGRRLLPTLRAMAHVDDEGTLGTAKRMAPHWQLPDRSPGFKVAVSAMGSKAPVERPGRPRVRSIPRRCGVGTFTPWLVSTPASRAGETGMCLSLYSRYLGLYRASSTSCAKACRRCDAALAFVSRRGSGSPARTFGTPLRA